MMTTVTSPMASTAPLSERLAALKDRMGAGPEVDSLSGAMAQLDDQQGQLLSLVATLSAAVKDLAPRIAAELPGLTLGSSSAPGQVGVVDLSALGQRIESLERLVRALAEVVNENADSHQAALTSLRPTAGAATTPAGPSSPASLVPDPTPRLQSIAERLDDLSLAFIETAEAQHTTLTALSSGSPVDLTPRLDALSQRLDLFSEAVVESAESHQVVAKAVTDLKAVVDAQAEATLTAIAALHDHLDQAALAAVEAILSSR
jgi:hypothetical protein